MRKSNSVKMTDQQTKLVYGMIHHLDELSCGYHWAFSPNDEHTCWIEGFNHSQRLVLATYTYPLHRLDVIVPKDFDIDTLTFYQNLQDDEDSATLCFDTFEDLKKALDIIYECKNSDDAAGQWCGW